MIAQTDKGNDENANSTFDNDFMTVEQNYKYHNEFMWKDRLILKKISFYATKYNRIHKNMQIIIAGA